MTENGYKLQKLPKKISLNNFKLLEFLMSSPQPIKLLCEEVLSLTPTQETGFPQPESTSRRGRGQNC
jgi:hypothetical protein